MNSNTVQNEREEAHDFPATETGAKREKLDVIPYDQVPYQEITDAFARVAEHGIQKYGSWNWSKGIPRIQILGSLLRHTFAYIRGEERDMGPKGSGLLHTDHILWNAAVLVHNVHWGLADGRRGEPARSYKAEKIEIMNRGPLSILAQSAEQKHVPFSDTRAAVVDQPPVLQKFETAPADFMDT